MLLRILIATDDRRRANQLRELLSDEDVLITTLGNQDNLWEALGTGACDLLLIDESLFEGNTLSAIQDVRALPDAPEAVIFSRQDDPHHRAELLAANAFAVLNPSVTKAELIKALQTLVERRAEQARQILLAEQGEAESRLSDFSTSSPEMREFLSFVRRVVDSDSTLLVLGETGVGKEFLSRAIHTESPRSDAPFVAVNCSALSQNLLESELFGHVEGAFTGAQRSRRGYFELAHNGTLFIDEIGELSPQLQVKLLRAIQDRAIQPVGAEEDFEVNVRIIAATNRDLVTEMAEGRFRPDLYYRLSVVSLEIPPLRRRKEDIPSLVESHVEHFRISMNRHVESVADEAMDLLIRHPWPGNVRELINVVERAVLLCQGEHILPLDLPEELRTNLDGAPKSSSPDFQKPPEPTGTEAEESDLMTRPYHDARRELIEAFERRYLQALLGRANGRIADAARIAGLNPRSVYEKMKKHSVRKEFYKL